MSQGNKESRKVLQDNKFVVNLFFNKTISIIRMLHVRMHITIKKQLIAIYNRMLYNFRYIL